MLQNPEKYVEVIYFTYTIILINNKYNNLK